MGNRAAYVFYLQPIATEKRVHPTGNISLFTDKTNCKDCTRYENGYIHESKEAPQLQVYHVRKRVTPARRKKNDKSQGKDKSGVKHLQQ